MAKQGGNLAGVASAADELSGGAVEDGGDLGDAEADVAAGGVKAERDDLLVPRLRPLVRLPRHLDVRLDLIKAGRL